MTSKLFKVLSGVLFTIPLGLVLTLLSTQATGGAVQRDDARARELFISIVPVLKHPRCLNCHSTGDFPRQGDDGRIHIQNVRRGPDGKGKFGQKCIACHQEYNVAGLNMPPGAPNWHLPPPSMPM